jgi:hypothetical protein
MKRTIAIALLAAVHLSFAMDKHQAAPYKLENEFFQDAPANNHTAVPYPARQTRRETFIQFSSHPDGTLCTINVLYYAYETTSPNSNNYNQAQPLTSTQPVTTPSVSPTQPIAPARPTLTPQQIVSAQAVIDSNNNNNNAQKSRIGSITSPIKKGRRPKASVPTLSTSPITLPAGGYLISAPGIYSCFFCKTQLNQRDLKEHSCQRASK